MIPSYFPFTEPSADVHVGWSWENGRRVIGGAENWMEVLGSGMVHPRVIANCGLDPDEWQGFAFGCGVDRLAMLKYGMDDLRAFFDGDLRWLRHYGFAALDVPTFRGWGMKFSLSWRRALWDGTLQPSKSPQIVPNPARGGSVCQNRRSGASQGRTSAERRQAPQGQIAGATVEPVTGRCRCGGAPNARAEMLGCSGPRGMCGSI